MKAKGAVEQATEGPTKKLPGIRLHDLRRTHATLLRAGGVPVKVVSERLGHGERHHHARRVRGSSVVEPTAHPRADLRSLVRGPFHGPTSVAPVKAALSRRRLRG
jgi:integrase